MYFRKRTGFERFIIFFTNVGLKESSRLCHVPYISFSGSGPGPTNSSYNAVPIKVSKVFIKTTLSDVLLIIYQTNYLVYFFLFFLK